MKSFHSGLIVTGYLCCLAALFFLPPAFAIAACAIGITVLTDGRPRHGFALLALGITVGVAGTFLATPQPHRALMAFETSLQHRVNRLRDADDTASAPVNSLGETLSVGDWTYRCTQAEWQASASNTLETHQAPDSSFMVVDISIRNDNRTVSNRPLFKLVDSENREFSESPESFKLNDAISTSTALSPGVATSGRILFDVPPGRSYMLKVSGGSQSEKYALIDLMWQQQQTGIVSN